MSELIVNRSVWSEDERMSTSTTQASAATSVTVREIASQPEVWQQALDGLSPATAEVLRQPGARMLALGCGTSAFIAESFSALREQAGLGETDAAYASEPPRGRRYDAVIAFSRSGTTTEVIQALSAIPAATRKVVVTGTPNSPLAAAADDVVLLDFADEESVVQTRFPTTIMLLARAAFGEDVSALPQRAAGVLGQPLATDGKGFDHFVFLGHGWTYGLAQEAALKIREAAQAWSESYPLLDYRHGPLAVAGPNSLVVMIGAGDDDLASDIRATGATVVRSDDDPLIVLATLQRLAVAVAERRGLNPDSPRHLTRSIVLG